MRISTHEQHQKPSDRRAGMGILTHKLPVTWERETRSYWWGCKPASWLERRLKNTINILLLCSTRTQARGIHRNRFRATSGFSVLLLLILLLFKLDIHKNTILLFDLSGQTAYHLSFHSWNPKVQPRCALETPTDMSGTKKKLQEHNILSNYGTS